MAWEQRGSRRYYYKKMRKGGRVRSIYFGSSQDAYLIEEMTCQDPVGRQILREMKQFSRDYEQELENELDHMEQAIAHVLLAHLEAAGFRPHKGQWRRKRE